ncbi:LrgB family protein [Polluticaenibacter yanchengensis]|uniref:LrgB family protein n=1 Tax=Polluticaenibacter yanchengensis TaxID=3014562 RepID=A0ABT4UJ89_9BACT|nr:LrgB family protein [Chitinophagaceae bacterium LY-5]
MNRLFLNFRQISAATIAKTMLTGLVTGLVIISLFVFTVNNPKPEWGNNWRMQPLLLTPLVVAFGSLVFFANRIFQPQNKTVKTLLLIGSIIAFVFSIWIGIIIGLNGTLWN